MGSAVAEDLPDQESWGAALQISDEGVPRVALSAPYLARYEWPDSTVVRLGPDPRSGGPGRVEVQLFDQEGSPTATVHADHLDYYERERRFAATGRVVVTTAGGRQLESERVAWSEIDRRMRAEGAFVFTSPAERIEGVGLVANEDLSRYSFRRARGELEVDE